MKRLSTEIPPAVAKLMDLRKQEAALEEQIANLHTQAVHLLHQAGDDVAAEYGLKKGDRVQHTDKRRKPASGRIDYFTLSVSDDGASWSLVAWVKYDGGSARGITINDKTSSSLEVIHSGESSYG